MAQRSLGNLTTRRLEPTGRHDAAPYGVDRPRIVLVTGGGGFLGSHIVNQLLIRGDRVRVLGRRSYPELIARGVDCRQGDLCDMAAVRKAVDGVDAIVHSAALPGIGGEYRHYYDTNYVGTKNLIDAAIGANVRKFVYTSTPSVVHDGTDIKGGDESLRYPQRFVNPYASTKALAEQLVIKMNSDSFATLAIRPHLIFGPGDTQLIPKLLARARTGKLRRVGDGRNLVSVSYVENVAYAHCLAVNCLEPGEKLAGQVFFINEPEPVNCWDFINRILTGAGLPPVKRGVPFRVAYAAGWLCEKIYSTLGKKGDPLMTRFLAEQLATSHWFKTDKAQKELGWRPQVGLEEGIQKTLAYIASTGVVR